MNGALRGKIIAEESYDDKENLKMVRSALVADITGDEVSALPDFDIQSGDTDMMLRPDSSTTVTLPNLKDTEQVIVDLTESDGSPISVAPRNMLKKAIEKCSEAGYEIKVSWELEFYLYHRTGRQLDSSELDMPYASINSLHQYEKFLDAAVDMIRQIGLKPEMVLAESGQGQFEITFGPEDPLFMADRATYFKQLIKEIARDQGLLASFMAKPFEDDAGSGGHLHVSVYKDGQNIFLDEADLESFVAGQLRYMRSSMLLFAPNLNSYRRLETGHGYTPEVVSYGDEVRTTGVRVLGEGQNRRIEHRIGGADTNIYLILTAVLTAGLRGLEENLRYDSGSVAEEVGKTLPESMREALGAFREGNAKDLLGEDFVRVFSATKQQELELLENAGLQKEVEAYSQQV